MALSKTFNALEVFQKHCGTLVDAVSDQIPLAWKLYSKRIISHGIVQKVQGQPEYERSPIILEAVRNAVSAKPELLLEFVTILEQTDSPAADVAAEMRKDIESNTVRVSKPDDEHRAQVCVPQSAGGKDQPGAKAHVKALAVDSTRGHKEEHVLADDGDRAKRSQPPLAETRVGRAEGESYQEPIYNTKDYPLVTAPLGRLPNMEGACRCIQCATPRQFRPSYVRFPA